MVIEILVFLGIVGLTVYAAIDLNREVRKRTALLASLALTLLFSLVQTKGLGENPFPSYGVPAMVFTYIDGYGIKINILGFLFNLLIFYFIFLLMITMIQKLFFIKNNNKEEDCY